MSKGVNDWNELDINNLNSKFNNIKFSKITLEYYEKNIKI